MKIWIDADACPREVKEIVYRASTRLGLPVCLVANSRLNAPQGHRLVSVVQVPKGPDVADEHIVEQVSPEDLVVTADIPLAALIVERGAVALDPRGELYTAANVGERLSIRDFMCGMRDAGLIEGGGPKPYGPRDKQRFAGSFDAVITRMQRGQRP